MKGLDSLTVPKVLLFEMFWTTEQYYLMFSPFRYSDWQNLRTKSRFQDKQGQQMTPVLALQHYLLLIKGG